MINKDTQLCMSLSGRPGNFGTRFHNSLYQQLDLNYIYKAFSTTNIEDAVKGIRALAIRGCAISMPFKESCIPFLDELTDSVKAIDVNTIVNNNGHLKAYNTDYIAISKLIKQYQLNPTQSVMIHGSGGMAKAVIAAFHDNGFKQVTILARNVEKGTKLSQKYHFPHTTQTQEAHDILVNATSIVITPLINEANRQNKVTISGKEVMILQAVEQFILYTGKIPTTQQIEVAAKIASQA